MQPTLGRPPTPTPLEWSHYGAAREVLISFIYFRSLGSTQNIFQKRPAPPPPSLPPPPFRTRWRHLESPGCKRLFSFSPNLIVMQKVWKHFQLLRLPPTLMQI